jgi:predicted DNA-binding transcriptional regulator AlpA
MTPSNLPTAWRAEAEVLRRLGYLITSEKELEQVESEDIPELLAALEAVKARLWSRLMASSLPQLDPVESEGSKEPDRLLTAEEVADRISVKKKWLYDHFDQLPFGRRLADRTLRFSERGLEQWLERKAS